MKITKLEGATVISIQGNKKVDPEKAETIIRFPAGEVSITRTTDNKYWVHVYVEKDPVEAEVTGMIPGKIADARLDIHGIPAIDSNVGDFNHPDLYHLAVLVEKAA